MSELVLKIDDTVPDSVEKYSQLFPDLLSGAIAGLNKDNYRAIVVILDLEGRQSFTEIRKKVGLGSTSKLSYWLDKLEEEGLVVNDIIRTPNTRASSYYSLSRFGKDFLRKILEAYYDHVSLAMAQPKRTFIEPTFSGSINVSLEIEPTADAQKVQMPVPKRKKDEIKREPQEMIEIVG